MAAEHTHQHHTETDRGIRAVAYERVGLPTRLAHRVDYDSVGYSTSHVARRQRAWDIPGAVEAPDVYARFARLMSFHIRDL